MGLTKEEQKQLIELSAKAEGMPKKEFIATLAKEHGIEIAQPTRQDANTRFLDTILKAGSEGKLNMKEMMDSMMSYKMMEMMMGGGLSGKAETTPAPTGQYNIMELLANNDEKWGRRLEQDKQERKEEALQARLDRLETLIAAGTNKNDDPAMEKILAEVKETKAELKEAEKARNKDMLAAKAAEFSQYKEDMADRLDAIENREPPKSTDDMLYELAEKQSKFEKLMNGYGKAHGWNQARINDEMGNVKSPVHQLLSDLAGENGVLPKLIDAWGKKSSATTVEQPEVAQPLTCGNCHGISKNGTDWCDPCRIQYSNDVVAAQQKAASETAQKAPAQQTEAEARAKGEIPPADVQPEETQQA